MYLFIMSVTIFGIKRFKSLDDIFYKILSTPAILSGCFFFKIICFLLGKWYSTGIVSHSYGCGPNYIKATNKRNIFPFAVFADVNVFKEWIVNSIVYDSEPL